MLDPPQIGRIGAPIPIAEHAGPVIENSEFVHRIDRLTRKNELQERTLVVKGDHIFLYSKDASGKEVL